MQTECSCEEIEMEPFSKLLVKSFALSAVTTAGFFVGLMAVGVVKGYVDSKRKKTDTADEETTT